MTLSPGDIAPDFESTAMAWPRRATGRTADDVVVVRSLKDEAVTGRKFSKGYTAVRPCLRLTPQPCK